MATIFVRLLHLWVGNGFYKCAGRGLHKLLRASVERQNVWPLLSAPGVSLRVNLSQMRAVWARQSCSPTVLYTPGLGI